MKKIQRKPFDHNFDFSDEIFPYTFYTDGSCFGNKDVKKQICPTGWGIIGLQKDNNPNQPLIEFCGSVILNPQDPHFLGAEVASNNTAELTAIGEALRWLRNSNNSLNHGPILIRTDSEYAYKSVLGVFNGEKNKELIRRIRILYSEVISQRQTTINQWSILKPGQITREECIRLSQHPIQFKYVKAHSGEVWNERVDALAKQGATGRVLRQVWQREGTEQTRSLKRGVEEGGGCRPEEGNDNGRRGRGTERSPTITNRKGGGSVVLLSDSDEEQERMSEKKLGGEIEKRAKVIPLPSPSLPTPSLSHRSSHSPSSSTFLLLVSSSTSPPSPLPSPSLSSHTSSVLGWSFLVLVLQSQPRTKGGEEGEGEGGSAWALRRSASGALSYSPHSLPLSSPSLLVLGCLEGLKEGLIWVKRERDWGVGVGGRRGERGYEGRMLVCCEDETREALMKGLRRGEDQGVESVLRDEVREMLIELIGGDHEEGGGRLEGEGGLRCVLSPSDLSGLEGYGSERGRERKSGLGLEELWERGRVLSNQAILGHLSLLSLPPPSTSFGMGLASETPVAQTLPPPPPPPRPSIVHSPSPSLLTLTQSLSTSTLVSPTQSPPPYSTLSQPFRPYPVHLQY